MPKSKGRKAAASKSKKRPSVQWLTFEFDAVPLHLRAEFERRSGEPQISELHPEGGLIHQRMISVKRIIAAVVPPRTRIRLWITEDMGDTLRKVDPGRYGDGASAYSRDRGANEAAAKTVRNDDGTFDVLIDYVRFLNFFEDSADDVAETTAILEHLAAHEPQHILMHLRQTDSSYLQIGGESPTANDLVPIFAEAVDEFRCELAANRIVVSGLRPDLTTEDDLEHLRSALNESVDIMDEDRVAAWLKTRTAIKEFIKSLAYLSALYVAEGTEAVPPPNVSHAWGRYVGANWPEILALFSSIPAANEDADTDELAEAVYRGAGMVSAWMTHIGVDYRADANGERACLWQTDSAF
ncbi:hypothetical protein ABZU78_11785 [Rhodococcus erythropolis]|uniref:hypothetical protein n=1 Tax=Rhodococcus erythropolis TaxID=1833 RepID=UPI0033B64104